MRSAVDVDDIFVDDLDEVVEAVVEFDMTFIPVSLSEVESSNPWHRSNGNNVLDGHPLLLQVFA